MAKAFDFRTLVDPDTNRMAICYSGADTVVALAFARMDEFVEFVKMIS